MLYCMLQRLPLHWASFCRFDKAWHSKSRLLPRQGPMGRMNGQCFNQRRHCQVLTHANGYKHSRTKPPFRLLCHSTRTPSLFQKTHKRTRHKGSSSLHALKDRASPFSLVRRLFSFPVQDLTEPMTKPSPSRIPLPYFLGAPHKDLHILSFPHSCACACSRSRALS